MLLSNMFSPTSIADFLACPHITTLKRAAAEGVVNKPHFYDPQLELLIKLGQRHEADYLRLLREHGKSVVEISSELSREEAAKKTIEVIKSGVDVVFQPTFLSGDGEDLFGGDDKLKLIGHWYGRADFLVRVERASELGEFSYEVVETKLARSTKARAIIQLCFYSDLLAQIQGVIPEFMHVVLGGGVAPEKFYVQRYLAFFRRIKKEFIAAQSNPQETYPEPVEHCRICDWTTVCDEKWREDDHLSLVANITRNQRDSLTTHGSRTVAMLARLAADTGVEGIKEPAFLKLQQQARLQFQGREEQRTIYELLVPPEVGKGLCSLPVPSQGDLFLDFEGDNFAFPTGLEYLFGVLGEGIGEGISLTTESQRGYEASWAINPADEKRAFERFIGSVMQRREQYPDMHIYHYGSYEETAIKRMAGQHSTCVDEVDELLRAEVFVDMLRVVRQGLRASVESYSIKKLEPFYNYQRDVKLGEATRALIAFQSVLALGPEAEDLIALKRSIEGYNRDDCVSAMMLRDWLEERRLELESQVGEVLPRPVPKDQKPDEDLTEYLQKVRDLESQLTQGLPETRDDCDDAEEARWLLAQLLEWHRREDKSSWWNYYRLCDLSDQELIEDKAALGGLQYVGEVEQVKKSVVHRYKFPLQDHAIDRAPTIHDPKTQKGAGEVVRLDQRNLTIDIKRGATSKVPHPTAVIPYEIVGSKVMRESLLQLGRWVAENGIDSKGPFRVARDLLLRKKPAAMAAAAQAATPLDKAISIVKTLNRNVLPVQGPPGSGKTFTGARMILELVKAGKKVGVTAVSHKVITKLLSEVCAAARKANVDCRIIQKCERDGCVDEFVKQTDDNEEIVAAVEHSEVQVIGGTVWLWSRDDLNDAIDVLFVDEAGQMSLANVLAASKCAESVVLLGDPQQLDQPQRGVHPVGAEASALSHLLEGRATIDEDQGLFLADSWRLHPEICRFTSEVFYEGRLRAREENGRQSLNVAQEVELGLGGLADSNEAVVPGRGGLGTPRSDRRATAGEQADFGLEKRLAKNVAEEVELELGGLADSKEGVVLRRGGLGTPRSDRRAAAGEQADFGLEKRLAKNVAEDVELGSGGLADSKEGVVPGSGGLGTPRSDRRAAAGGQADFGWDRNLVSVTGLKYVPVVHRGNQSESLEEVARVVGLVNELINSGATWTNKVGQDGYLTLQDILVVAPYNRQVSALLQALPQGARVGTVDKFQGQEAPVVIYSMATSTPEDAPRGMEFLYSSNRLNVATSRAQCVTVLVASPALFDVSCKTPKQMELVNAFCRYLELATG